MADRQRTIAREVSLSGIGLHSGADTSVVFKPAPAGTGVRFIRTDLESRPSVDVDVDAAVPGEDFSRRTTIGGSGACVGTVEHVLAALRGLGIDNAIVEIDAAEPPEPDGSCAPYVEVLKRAGAVEQDEERRYLVLTEPVEFIEGGIELRAVPYDGLRISFSISYDHPLIGTQDISLEISEDVFEKEIAPARTFSLLKDVERLKQRGLIRGGSLQNSIVVGDDEILNEGSLRFEDEFVRHKVLDLLGDLCLLGRPLKMHVSSVRSGHSTNLKFVKMLHRSLMKADKGLALGRQVSEVPTSLTIDQIQKIMPHRYPFLLVDRILSLEPGKSVVGIKNVTINEPFFVGHFPSGPIMPAVLILEAMAQVGGVMLLSMVEDAERKLVYFMGIDKAKFRRPVVPGDQLRFELEMLKLRSKTCKMRGRAFVEDALVAEAELTSALVDKPGQSD
jgi:UDP-3-O-[3-hydroxymyristoyl] N-acetylglucosamine deacetylase/3-hydroxyacyl-[acyl-carrier-protein] dehydratase